MVPDAEVITVACEVLEKLEIGNIMVKLSHRQLLHAMVTSCGVSEAQFKPICSAIDKLDKGEFILFNRSVFCANPAHNLTCSLIFLI